MSPILLNHHPLKKILLFLLFLITIQKSYSDQLENKLIRSYPHSLSHIENNELIWQNKKRLPLFSGHPSLYEQLTDDVYPIEDNCYSELRKTDPGRKRHVQFFKMMYGENEKEVLSHLIFIPWLPHYLGPTSKISVTTIENVHLKFARISNELEVLLKFYPEYMIYLHPLGGTFNWRFISHSKDLSLHSFGIAIDLNPLYANYWLTPNLINTKIPCDIVRIFEKNGFIWGGKWQHYDTMHFEYRPELLP